MADKIGPLLQRALDRLSFASSKEDVLAIASVTETSSHEKAVPIVVKIPTITPSPNEAWTQYRDRVQNELAPLRKLMQQTMNVDPTPLITANSLQVIATPAQVEMLRKQAQVTKMELDPLLPVTLLDDCANDLLLGNFRIKHPVLDGTGVKVAVLDSGIDTQHPYLNVTASVSTCDESVEHPGQHATHCAGIIASRDLVFSGVAPRVDLLNIKVLNANGTGGHGNVTKGIDETVKQGAQVISMSLGFNHLPHWSDGGHGWSCTDGDCPLCTAVDNAVTLNNALVVVAAGNEHDRAEALRASGFGHEFDTELDCPGQARKAIAVGALTKQTFSLASFSSRGPTSFNESKPILCAPGVNIRSTVPVQRDENGKAIADPPRPSLFDRDSGTSMAAPFVAGVAALLIQRQILAGQPWTPAGIREELLARGVLALAGSPNEVGGGRLSLGKF